MTWTKGQSGNPGGRGSKIGKPLRELAKLYTEEALQTTLELMRHSSMDNVKLSAANLILDRGWGRATIIVDQERASDMSDSELMQKSIEVIMGKVDNAEVHLMLTKTLQLIQQMPEETSDE